MIEKILGRRGSQLAVIRGHRPATSLFKHWKDEFLIELVLLKRNFFWIILLICSIFFHNTSSNLAYFLYNKAEAYKLAPLHDWLYDILPKVSSSAAELICNVSFYIINITLALVIFQPFFRTDYVTSRLSLDMIRSCPSCEIAGREYRNGATNSEWDSVWSLYKDGATRISSIHMIRRFSAAYFIGCLLRCTSFLITTLPGTAAHCLQEPLGTYDSTSAPSTLKDVFWNTNWETKCGDLIFSGHSQQSILATLIIHRYCSIRFIPFLMWPLLFLFEYSIIVTRRHYSVDVLVAVYVVPLIWHSLIQSSLLDEANDHWAVEKFRSRLHMYRCIRNDEEASQGVVV
eukprot:jgi/Galph1/2713/GphlegSOOS_G1438.1